MSVLKINRLIPITQKIVDLSDLSLKLDEVFTGDEEFFSVLELSSSVFSLTTCIFLIKNVSILFQL
jgi:hypothetical protein